MTRSDRATRIIRALPLALAILLCVFGATTLEGATPKGKVNINTADVEALALLPRVGSVVAKRIVDFRQENGAFDAVEDLMLVQGIGERTFALIEPFVSLEGDTTLQEKVRVADDSTSDDAI